MLMFSPPELIPNVDLDRWLPQPQRKWMSHEATPMAHKSPAAGNSILFHLGSHPSGTTPSGPMARRKCTSAGCVGTPWQPCMMLAETRIDSGRTMWQRLKSHSQNFIFNLILTKQNYPITNNNSTPFRTKRKGVFARFRRAMSSVLCDLLVASRSHRYRGDNKNDVEGIL